MVNGLNETLPLHGPAYCRLLRQDRQKQSETKIFAIWPESWTNKAHGHSQSQHPGRRGRPRNPDVDCEVPAQQRLQRHRRERRPRDVARHGRPSRRPDHPRRHAARRGRPQPVPQGALGGTDAHHHADRARRGRRPHRRPRDGRGRLSAEAVQPARAARPHQRGAAPPGRGAERQARSKAPPRSPSRAGASTCACANCAIPKARASR